MINPNARHVLYGVVLSVDRERNRLVVRTTRGSVLEELGFLEIPRGLSAGDSVRVSVGFSIVSDQYGVGEVQRVTRSRVTGRFVEAVVDFAARQGVRCRWSETEGFVVNGGPVRPERVLTCLGLDQDSVTEETARDLLLRKVRQIRERMKAAEAEGGDHG